jgi:heptose I phosphotransferase
MIDPQLTDFITQAGLDSLAGAFAYQNGQDLSKPNLGHRRRTRLEFRDGQSRCWELYLKRYGPVPLRIRLARLIRGRGFSSEAGREFANIRHLREAGVPTMRAIVWGQQFGPLGVRRSYIVVTAVPGDAVERVGDEFLTKFAAQGELIDEFTSQLVELVRRLHQAGFVHRDLYASHIFLHEHDGRVELNLIDLARVFKPRCRLFRWRVKDLAQLKYSMPWLWVERYWDTFLRAYLQTQSPVEIVRWSRAIDAKVLQMQRRQQRRARRAARRANS